MKKQYNMVSIIITWKIQRYEIRFRYCLIIINILYNYVGFIYKHKTACSKGLGLKGIEPLTISYEQIILPLNYRPSKLLSRFCFN